MAETVDFTEAGATIAAEGTDSNSGFTFAHEDLERSGLTLEDINGRIASAPDFAACGMPTGSGYVIPYYDIDGRLRPFYRIRTEGGEQKYLQPKGSANYTYFPRSFKKQVIAGTTSGVFPRHLIICEGEKKAALLAKHGHAAVAFGGVDSWRNRTLFVPSKSDLNRDGRTDSIRIKLPSGATPIEEASTVSTMAMGFVELIDYVVNKRVHVVICYDTDGEQVRFEVQRAAAQLAFEMRYRGVPYEQVHQLILPPNVNPEESMKVAVDDFIQSEGISAFDDLLSQMFQKHSTFPVHPNVKTFVDRALQRTKLSRKEANAVSLGVLSDMDATGRRLKSTTAGQYYYFDSKTRRLIKADFFLNTRGALHGTDFGQHLYRRYGLSGGDNKLLNWLDAQFHSEQPVEEVTPHRIIARPRPNEDILRFQINDGQYAKVTGDADHPITILDNGSDGFLFEAGHVESLNADDLLREFHSTRIQHNFKPWWLDVLDTVRLKEHADDTKYKTLVALLYYVAPWLYKWRGSQLPVELVIGESGSGKSSLCEHRLGIISGRSELRNAPTDIKDWHASVTNTGGLHVVDNVQLLDKNLRQRLSDEICRIITEQDPHVEMRRLYSNNELIRLPITCSFGITAISQPFHQVDLLQRAVLVELDKSLGGADSSALGVEYDSSWVDTQTKRFGGRTAWVAHHLFMVHRFFREVSRSWDPKYIARHRLINFEQSLLLMGRAMNLNVDWIPDYLSGAQEHNISEADWALDALQTFADEVKRLGPDKFSAADIADWAQAEEDFKECYQVTNSRRLGRYLQSHKQLVAQVAGIVEYGKRNNKLFYTLQTS